jgi:3-oxoacyl-[acyl-carrier protein] reductase
MPDSMTKPLAGKIALVTGAARKIGRAIALGLAEDGASVVVHTRSTEAEAGGVVAEIEKRGGTGMVCLADITDESQVRAMAVKIGERFGRLDVLVNNAAIRGQAPFTEMTLAQWREVTGTILDGTFIVTSSCVPLMLKSGEGGAIINIGGISAHIGAPHRAHVIAAKSGIVGLTRALAVELAPHRVTANCIVPGRIAGPRGHTAGIEPPLGSGQQPLVPRFGAPEEVAAMMRPLWLPTGAYITGQVIHVNGGMHLN